MFQYALNEYGTMMADSVRARAYHEALRRTVGVGSVVVDIGTGIGFFAFLACRCGARKVYAIEPNDAIHVARQIAEANGYADRIEFIQGASTRATLPERADVISSDLRGVLPLLDDSLLTITDARKRFLKPRGTLIPLRDRLWAAVVEAPDWYRSSTAPWDHDEWSLDMRPAQRIQVNVWHRGKVTPEQLLTTPYNWASLDYTVIEDGDVSAEMTWTAERAGVGHGLITWFDATLADGVSLSNAPGAPGLVYPQGLFPWLAPVNLSPGDTITVALQAKLIADHYVWCWNTRVVGQGPPAQVKADFRQSTFLGTPLSRATLRQRAATYVPSLNEDGQIAQYVLQAMAAHAPLGDIARDVSARFRARFPSWVDALGHVGNLSQRYS